MADGVFTLRTDHLLGSTDTFLTLYDTDGTSLLLANDDIVSGVDGRSQIIWLAPTSGGLRTRTRLLPDRRAPG